MKPTSCLPLVRFSTLFLRGKNLYIMRGLLEKIPIAYFLFGFFQVDATKTETQSD